MNKEFRYNYVILGSDGYYLVGYKDVIGLDNVHYYTRYNEGLNSIVSRMARLTISKSVNRFVPHPFSGFVFPRLFQEGLSSKKPVCMLVFSSYAYLYDISYFDWLKKKHPDCKFVMFYQDKVRVHTPNMDFKHLKKLFDIVYSYDMHDCNEFDLKYHPTPYSRFEIPCNEAIPASDVFYCGRAKSRYQLVLQVYESLTRQGMKCDFYLSSVPSDCPRIPGIHYDEWLSYLEYLQHLSKSRAILEVQQEGADGFTPRFWESIIYDKHLITDNDAVFHSMFYNPSYHHSVDNVLADSVDFINEEVQYSEVEKNNLSPINFLHNIEQNL